jgi:hypothetical protein
MQQEMIHQWDNAGRLMRAFVCPQFVSYDIIKSGLLWWEATSMQSSSS